MEGGSFAAIGIQGHLIYIDPTRRLIVAINVFGGVSAALEDVDKSSFCSLHAALESRERANAGIE